MEHGVRNTLGLLEHKEIIQMFLLIYSFNKYLLEPFSIPGTAGNGKQMFSQVKHKTVTDYPVSPQTHKLKVYESSTSSQSLPARTTDIFYALDRILLETGIAKCWDYSLKGLGKTGGNMYRHFLISIDCHWCTTVLGAFPPSYSCFLGHTKCVLVPHR